MDTTGEVFLKTGQLVRKTWSQKAQMSDSNYLMIFFQCIQMESIAIFGAGKLILPKIFFQMESCTKIPPIVGSLFLIGVLTIASENG